MYEAFTSQIIVVVTGITLETPGCCHMMMKARQLVKIYNFKTPFRCSATHRAVPKPFCISSKWKLLCCYINDMIILLWCLHCLPSTFILNLIPLNVKKTTIMYFDIHIYLHSIINKIGCPSVTLFQLHQFNHGIYLLVRKLTFSQVFVVCRQFPVWKRNGWISRAGEQSRR